MLIILLISFFSLFSLNTQAQCTGVTESDSLELVSLLTTLNEFNDTISSPISEWGGITLTEDGCHILSIIKSNSNQEAQLLDWSFPQLETLIFRNFYIGGCGTGFLPTDPSLNPMPDPEGLDQIGPTGPYSEIGISITPLTPMGGQSNGEPTQPVAADGGFYLPSSLGELIDFSNMPNLKTLMIFDISLSGTIPNFSHLPNLEELHLHSNHFNEATLPDFSNLPNLKTLNISNNAISGSIPNFTNNPNLEILQLTQNELTGAIPNFENQPNLSQLYLSDNELSGSIPDFDNSPNLTLLYLNDNQLSGNIPEFNLANLTKLCLNYNQLSGNIPNFNNLTSLQYLFVNNNQLSGSIPTFSDLNSLYRLYLNHNELTGEIPDFNNLLNLTNLYLHNNQLSETIPDFSSLSELKYLLLQNNELSGTIPNFSNLPNLISLALNHNQLSGDIPNFDNLNSLNRLYLNDNQLSGVIPNFNMENTYFIALNNNQLSGGITNFSNLPMLKTLYLNGNQLSGNIPNFSGVNPVHLFLNNNQLSGEIPLFENLSLHTLHLHNNQLHGLIPNFDFPSLQDLTVCDNLNLIAPLPNLENCPNFDWDDNEVDLSCINFVELSGYIYHDENANCVQDAGEAGIPNGRVYINDGYALAIADENGFYQFKLDTGTYALTYEPPVSYWEQTCPVDFEFFTQTISSYDDDYIDLHIANEALIDCPALSVDLGTPLQRRCFENTYYLEFCNNGTIPAEDAYLEVFFPENIIPLSSDLEYEDDGEGLLTFDLGTLAIGECQSFSIVDSVSCDAILGSTSCVEATIFPNYKCIDLLPLWDESDLNITGFCQDDFITFDIENQGEDMSVSTVYRVYENDILSAVEVIQLDSGEDIELDFENTGVTYRVAVEQTPNHPLYDIVQSVVEACDEEVFSLGFVNSQSEGDASLAFESDCQEIIGAYDPNDKLVTPSGIGDARCITTEDELTYKIRFQNTGNDTAFTVIVVDTINTALLDITSIKMAGSSHDYELSVVDGNVLEWRFDNILLVDSNANETASHGFLQFKIKQQVNNPINSVIRNEADIYFDYNDPITTPETFNHVCFTPEEFNTLDIETSIEEMDFKPSIYPNPINDYCIIDAPSTTIEKIRITDINGREVLNQTIDSVSDIKINTSNLIPGLYYFHLHSAQEYTVQKLIKH